MAACLLVVLASAPSIDAIVCQDDAAIATSQTTLAETPQSAFAPATVPHGGDASDICPHGHCHHFGVYVGKEPLRQAMMAVLDVHASDPGQRFPPSLPGATPERPPRV